MVLKCSKLAYEISSLLNIGIASENLNLSWANIFYWSVVNTNLHFLYHRLIRYGPLFCNLLSIVISYNCQKNATTPILAQLGTVHNYEEGVGDQKGHFLLALSCIVINNCIEQAY